MSLDKLIGKSSQYKNLSCNELEKRLQFIIEKIKEAREQGFGDLAKTLEKEYKTIRQLITDKGCEIA